jgi:hypothetical protein
VALVPLLQEHVFASHCLVAEFSVYCGAVQLVHATLPGAGQAVPVAAVPIVLPLDIPLQLFSAAQMHVQTFSSHLSALLLLAPSTKWYPDVQSCNPGWPLIWLSELELQVSSTPFFTFWTGVHRAHWSAVLSLGPFTR